MSEDEEKPARDELGRLLPGHSANPSGENGLKGLPDLMTRQQYFESHYTVADLEAIMKDKVRFGKLSVTDAQIVTHLAASIAGGKERGKERERYYDRKYGKPVQTIKTIADAAPSPEELNELTDEEAAVIFEKDLKD